MATVPVWTGREIRALREARRMAVRTFAEHVGVSDRMVSKWEDGGASIQPRPSNQAALDESLRRADGEVRVRFERIINMDRDEAQRSREEEPLPRIARRSFGHLAEHPIDGKLMARVEPGPFRPKRARRDIWVPGFYIDVYPVTVGEYERFLNALGPPRLGGPLPSFNLDGVRWPAAEDPSRQDPMAGVDWEHAREYARWACKQLPTDVEWQRAKRGNEARETDVVAEWRDTPFGPVNRGSKGAEVGGFRCVTSVTDMMTLMAI